MFRMRRRKRRKSRNLEQTERSGKPKTLHYLKSKGVPNSPPPPIIVKVRVDDCLLSMEVDTGAAVPSSLRRPLSFYGQGRA